MVRLALILALLAVLAAGCEDTQRQSDSTPTSQAETHEHPADFNEVVRAGAERAATAGFTGTYTMRARVNDQQAEGHVTWHRKGARARVDFVGTFGGEDVELTLIAGPDYPADDLLYACRPAEERCVEERKAVGGDYRAVVMPALLPLRVLDAGIFATGLNFLDEVGRVIAEQDVLCFVGQSTDASAGLANGEVCLTEVGVPVLVTASGSGTTVSLTALEPAGDFNELAFELPFALDQE